jgi:cell division septation protein DedD
MAMNKIIPGIVCAMVLVASGCSRQQSDWEKARAANTTDSYELFLKKYPSGEFTAQAQARVKELYEERDWQKARDADTPEAYQAFLKQYPEGKWTEEARIRVENFTRAQAPSGAPAGADAAPAPVPAAAPTTSAPPAGPEPTPKPPVKPLGKAPVKASAKAAAKSMAKAAVKSASPAKGGYGVQLGAFGSGEAAANKHWSELQAKFPAALGTLTPRVTPATTANGTIYRLQVAGLSRSGARSICKSLKAQGEACVLVIPRRATGPK